MKENPDTWRSWLPPEETKCPVGNQRLLNEAAPGGIECVECAAGFFSSGGLVSECTACAPGACDFGARRSRVASGAGVAVPSGLFFRSLRLRN